MTIAITTERRRLRHQLGYSDAEIDAQLAADDEAHRALMPSQTVMRLDDIRYMLYGIGVVLLLILWRVW
jgi:hypothetical protein